MPVRMPIGAPASAGTSATDLFSTRAMTTPMTTAAPRASTPIVVYWRLTKASAPSRMMSPTSCMALGPLSRESTSRARYSANRTAATPAIGTIQWRASAIRFPEPPVQACSGRSAGRVVRRRAAGARHGSGRERGTARASVDRGSEHTGARGTTGRVYSCAGATGQTPSGPQRIGCTGRCGIHAVRAAQRRPSTARVDGASPARPGPEVCPSYTPAVDRHSSLGCLVEVVETLVLTLVIFFVIQNFIAQPYQVQQNSMERTLEPGQYVLVDKLTPRLDPYKRGDVIVFTPPADVRERHDPVHQAGDRPARRPGRDPRRRQRLRERRRRSTSRTPTRTRPASTSPPTASIGPDQLGRSRRASCS